MKILSIIRTGVCLSSMAVCVFNLNAQGTLRPRGDVNCDWEVNIADLNTLIEAIMSDVQYHSFYTYALDINGDREINIADVNAITNAILGGVLPPMPSCSGTLPVLYINTEGYHDIVGKENADYLHADWWLDPMGIEGVEPLGSPSQPLGMLIKGRGNYSWTNFSKKPFRIKLDTKQPLMGMKKNRHFCLLPRDHWSTPFGFELSRRMGLAYTPALAPVEVVLNGQYIGLYLLAEKIRVGKDRVNVEEQKNGETDEHLITGGWLIEIDNHPDDNQFGLTEGNGNWLAVKYHSPDSLSHEQYDYIYRYITDTDRSVYATNDTVTVTPDATAIAGDSVDVPLDSVIDWTHFIDIDTLACFYIVNEIADNIESFTNSLYIHKQRGDSTKLLFGPVWDMGCAYGRPELEEPCFIYENTAPNYTPHWLGKLVERPEFQEAVRRHWNRFKASELNSMEDYMNAIVDKMTQASRADHARWPEEYIWFNDIKVYSDDYYIPQFRKKIEFLDEQWGAESPSGEKNEIEASGVVTLEGGFNVEKGATFAVYPSCF